METKTCCTCKQSQPLSDFQVDRQQPSGYRGQCKKCKAKRRKELNNGAQKMKVNGVRKERPKRVKPEQSHKFCKKCNTLKEIKDFYPKRIQEHVKNGHFVVDYTMYQSQCKECQKKAVRVVKEPAKVKPHPEGVKVCFGCKQDKPYSDFNRNAAAKDKYQSRCRTCEAEKFKNKRVLEINYAHFYYPVNDF